MNVGFSAFHEGRGAGKTDHAGGHDLVRGKRNSYAEAKVTGQGRAWFDLHDSQPVGKALLIHAAMQRLPP